MLDEFRIQGLLGSGGFANTYLATDLTLGREVAIKEFFPAELAVRSDARSVSVKSGAQANQFEWARSRFVREAKTLAKFRHPSVVRVFRVFDANNTAYIVLEFVRGANMGTWLKQLQRRPSQEEFDNLLPPLLDALEVVHAAGILHRDIKPANIYIREADHTPVLLDFGAAKYASAGDNAGTTAAIVSKGYSPNEAYSTDTRLQGPWTDIYGLSATIYRALTGTAPPESTSRILHDECVLTLDQEELRGDYREEFLAAVDRALEIIPRDRPQSVDEWRKELFPSLDLLRPAAKPIGYGPSNSEWKPLSDTPGGTETIYSASPSGGGSDAGRETNEGKASWPSAPGGSRTPSGTGDRAAANSSGDVAASGSQPRGSRPSAASSENDSRGRRGVSPGAILGTANEAVSAITRTARHLAGPALLSGNASFYGGLALVVGGAGALAFTVLTDGSDADRAAQRAEQQARAERLAMLDRQAVAERERRAEQQRIAAERAALERAAQDEAERKRLAEEKRQAEEEAERKRLAEEKRQAEEEAERKRLAEEKRQAEEEAERKRLAEEKRQAEEEAERKRLAEEKRQAEEEAERKRLAEEERRAEEEAERKRLAEEKRRAEEEAERKRLAEEKRRAEEKAERKRLAEEKRQAEEEAERKRLAEEKRRAEEEAERKRLAEEKRRAEEEAERKRLAEEKRRAEEEAERKRLAEEKRREDEKRRIAELNERRFAERQAQLKTTNSDRTCGGLYSTEILNRCEASQPHRLCECAADLEIKEVRRRRYERQFGSVATEAKPAPEGDIQIAALGETNPKPSVKAREGYLTQMQTLLKEQRCYDGAINGRVEDTAPAVEAFTTKAGEAGPKIELASATTAEYENWLSWFRRNRQRYCVPLPDQDVREHRATPEATTPKKQKSTPKRRVKPKKQRKPKRQYRAKVRKKKPKRSVKRSAPKPSSTSTYNNMLRGSR